jgi:hypothetical protein
MVVNRYFFTGTTGTWSSSRIEIPEQGSGSELFFFFPNNNQNKTQMKMKQNNRTTNNNWRMITNTSNDYD